MQNTRCTLLIRTTTPFFMDRLVPTKKGLMADKNNKILARPRNVLQHLTFDTFLALVIFVIFGWTISLGFDSIDFQKLSDCPPMHSEDLPSVVGFKIIQ